MTRKSIAACGVAFAAIIASCSSKNQYDAYGTFEATEVTVSAESTGVIKAFDLEEGDSLVAGVQVGAIDTVQLYLQKLQLTKKIASDRSNRPDIKAQAEALRQQISHEQSERERFGRLLKDGAATQKQLDDADAQIRILQGQLEALLSTLNNNTLSIDEGTSAIELQIAEIEDQLEHCRIKSPITGRVLDKYAELGEFAATGRALFKIADLDNIYLRAYFTSDQLSRLRLGMEVTVTADFGGGEQYDYPGKITWISSESEFTPKNIQTNDTRADLVYAVKISVPNDGRLKIGLSGNVKL